jgi:hypothetical protein
MPLSQSKLSQDSLSRVHWGFPVNLMSNIVYCYFLERPTEDVVEQVHQQLSALSDEWDRNLDAHAQEHLGKLR